MVSASILNCAVSYASCQHIHVCTCVFSCVCVFPAWWQCGCLNMNVDARGQDWMTSLTAFHLIFWERILTETRAHWFRPSCLHLPSAHITGAFLSKTHVNCGKVLCNTPGAGLANGCEPPNMGLLTADPPFQSMTTLFACFSFLLRGSNLAPRVCTASPLQTEPSPWPLSHSFARLVLSFRLGPALLDPFIGLSLLLCLPMSLPHSLVCKLITAHSSLQLMCLALPYDFTLSLPLSPYLDKSHTDGPQYMLAGLRWVNGIFFFWQILFIFHGWFWKTFQEWQVCSFSPSHLSKLRQWPWICSICGKEFSIVF